LEGELILLFAFIFLHKYISFDSKAILFSVLWGVGFSLLNITQMSALKHTDTSNLFPLTSLSSNVLVVLIGLTFFKDNISLLQAIGVFLAIALVFFSNNTKNIFGRIDFNNLFLRLFLTIVLLSTFNKFIQKFGAINTNVYNFIFWELIFALISSIILMILFEKKAKIKSDLLSLKVLLWAFIFGGLNFISTATITKALSTGPFSVVYTINSFYVFITAIVAWVLFGENLTRKKVIFLFISVLIIILIKIG
jgi:drug/metabolite transporter (DMT)-like permease